MAKFFALNDLGQLVYLGKFKDFNDADLYADKNGINVIWLVSDEAKQWQKVLIDNLKGA